MACAGRSPSCESAGPPLTQAFAWCNDPPVGRRFIPGFGCKRPRRAGNCCAPAPGWEFVDEPAKTAPHDVIPPRWHWLLAKPETSAAIVGRNSLQHLHRALPEPSRALQRRSSTAGQARLARLQDRVPVVIAMPQQSRSPVRRNAASPAGPQTACPMLAARQIQAFARSTLVRVRVQAWSFLFHSW
jgi:hypothetical protein